MLVSQKNNSCTLCVPMFSQYVTSALFLGNMLRAQKYRFALCFRVLSNQYVERSANANIFNFNRENEHFERGKLNSRCFHWFPAAMLELQHGVSILNTIIFSDTFCRLTRVRNIAHPRNLSRCLFTTPLRSSNFLTQFIKLTCVT